MKKLGILGRICVKPIRLYYNVCLTMVGGDMVVFLFLSLVIGVVDMRNNGGFNERPSRIVTLKQGRVQGMVRDLPIQQTLAGSSDDVDGDTYRCVYVISVISFQDKLH